MKIVFARYLIVAALLPIATMVFAESADIASRHKHDKASMPFESHSKLLANTGEEKKTGARNPRHQHQKASMPGASHSQMLANRGIDKTEAANYPRHKHYKASVPRASHVNK